jgi:tetraacyldisaccharide 4'-kinase
MPLNLPPVLKALLFYPLSILYGIVTSTRNTLFDLKILSSKEFNLPIISVGNITVGGTGKTPHIEYLIELLQTKHNVVTLSRGYKRKTKGFLIADKNSTVAKIGDEPLQIKKKYPKITVAVDGDRVNGINQLIRNGKAVDTILLDDAFQHRYVKPGLSILLIDYNRLITRDHLLPFGMLREKRIERQRANVIIITKCPVGMKPIERRIVLNEIKPFPFQDLFFTSIRYDEPVSVFDSNRKLTNRELLDKRPNVLLVCGIANPEPLIDYTKRFSDDVQNLIFPDHYKFKESDLQKIVTKFNVLPENSIILTTEKDAVRLRELSGINKTLKKNFYYIPVGVNFLGGECEKFNERILNYVTKNKRNGFIHHR